MDAATQARLTARAERLARDPLYQRVRRAYHKTLPYTPVFFAAHCLMIAGIVLSLLTALMASVIAAAQGRGEAACVLLFAATSGLVFCSGWLVFLCEYARIVGDRPENDWHPPTRPHPPP